MRKQKYKNLLTSLSDMGFLDFDRNLRTAERIGTDINLVFEELGKPEQPLGASMVGANPVRPQPLA